MLSRETKKYILVSPLTPLGKTSAVLDCWLENIAWATKYLVPC